MDQYPDDILWEVAARLDNVDASMLKMTCQRLQHIISQTHPGLPIPKPSYIDGTGKYQAELEHIEALEDTVDVGDRTHRKVFWATACIVGNGLHELQCDSLLKYLRTNKTYDAQYKAMYQEIVAKLGQWKDKNSRYKGALKALTRRWRRPTPAEEAEHGLAVMDAVIMVGADRLKRIPLLPEEAM